MPYMAYSATGVSDERVVLPDGPGSIGGVGENAEINPNMGQMSYSVPIELPEGYANMTPGLKLGYSSGNGASMVGIGWSMEVPSIERMSRRGLPKYTADDEFAADGEEELVRISADGEKQVYRARFEKSFLRYTWYTPGKSGYWTVEYPDGRMGFFGADDTGASVDTAMVSDADGNVFRWHLVAITDPFGHRNIFQYQKYDDYALISFIGYVYNSDNEPRFSVTFTYDVRDDVISDCVPGFDLQLDRRLASIQIFSSAEQIKQYVLTYEDYAASGGASRLVSIKQYGRNDVLHPIQFTFTYSHALGGVCQGDCQTPYMVDMGTIGGGAQIATGAATLIDINGDALPDVLNTVNGVHTFYIAALDAENHPTFSDTPIESSTVTGTSFTLGNPGVQVIDVNGDGFADIVDAKNKIVLCNNGTGDWAGSDCVASGVALPGDLEADADDMDEQDPLHVRFLDFDNDKRIDMIRTQSSITEVFHNTGDAFVQTTVEDIGEVFDESRLQLADMNGDNLQDPVVINPNLVRYRLNLGFGRWSGTSSDWVEIPMEGIDETAAGAAQLEDINGDGLADLVIVQATSVMFAINRNGAEFDPLTTLTTDDIDGDMPERTATTTVLFADMNGNGTDDIVWISTDGHVQFLELFPVKPNLLSRIENGIGYVQGVSYGTSVAEQARDASINPWKLKLPNPMNIVTSTDTWNKLTGNENGKGLHEVVQYRYHNGFYDGKEKSYRGYSDVEMIEPADPNIDSQEAGLTDYSYNVGADDPYFKGLLLKKTLYGGSEPDLVPISEERHVYGDCDVEGIPEDGLLFPIRFICEQQTVVIKQEGAAEAEWATIETDTAYDGWGNAIQMVDLGVVNMGPPESPRACSACDAAVDGTFGAPCGDECLGDEKYEESEFAAPGEATSNRWILNKPYREITYGDAGGPATEKLTYYDGDSFVGMELGTLSEGKISRVTEKVSDTSDDVVVSERNAFDTHGNIIETIDPNGSEDKTTTHRRKYTYDNLGLRVTKVEILTETADETPYSLTRDITYESAFLKPGESTAWMADGLSWVTPARNSTKYRYDEHGRIVRLIKPGDSDAAPTAEYEYDLASPASRIVVRSRSTAGADADLEEIRCIDGQGREFQRRTRLASGSYQVTGFTEFNRRGAEVRVYQPYPGDSDVCDTAPPQDVLYASWGYDAANREISKTIPDAALYDTASVSTRLFAPLAVFNYDKEDNNQDGSFYNTPTVEWNDGLDRLVAVDRYLTADTEPARLSIFYDSLGNVSGYEDAAGNIKLQESDLLGRILRVDDPNSGTTTMEYDAAGNLVRTEDARGEIRVMTYEGVNRRATLADGNDDAGASKVTWTYDSSEDCEDCINTEGQLARVTYPLGDFGTGIDEFAFDARGQPFFEARTIDEYRYKTSFTYDNAGRLIETLHPDGTQVKTTYDDASRIIGIDGVLNNVAYDEKGLVSEVDYSEGTVESFTWDDVKRLESIQIKAENTVLQGWKYSRSREDMISSIDDLSSEREGRPIWNALFGYDAWYRVLSAAFDPDGESAETVTYKFDNIDNILSITSSLKSASSAHVGEYIYDADKPNAAAAAGNIAMAYNEAGMMSSRADETLSWDYQGRLVEATKGEKTVGKFVYGPEEERIVKMENGGAVFSVNKDFEVRDGIGTAYVRFNNHRVARKETDTLAAKVLSDLAPKDEPDGAITAADAWLAYAAGEDIAAVDGEPSDVDRLLNSAARRSLMGDVYLHGDHQGSLTLATDKDGKVVGERAFYPTGEERFSEGYVDDYGFTGQEKVANLGLLHFKHRYLDSKTGRWVSVDPAFSTVTSDLLKKLGESTTAYAYVAGNFINEVDPDGLAKGGGTGGNTVQKKQPPPVPSKKPPAPPTGPKVSTSPTSPPKTATPAPSNPSPSNGSSVLGGSPPTGPAPKPGMSPQQPTAPKNDWEQKAMAQKRMSRIGAYAGLVTSGLTALTAGILATLSVCWDSTSDTSRALLGASYGVTGLGGTINSGLGIWSTAHKDRAEDIEYKGKQTEKQNTTTP